MQQSMLISLIPIQYIGVKHFRAIMEDLFDDMKKFKTDNVSITEIDSWKLV